MAILFLRAMIGLSKLRGKTTGMNLGLAELGFGAILFSSSSYQSPSPKFLIINQGR
jgi:hypothetical protein